MKRWFGFLIIFLLLTTASGFSQGFPPDFIKQQEEWLNRIKKENPKLYEFEKRFFQIQEEIQKIVEDYQKRKITKERAREKIVPLLKEEIEIRNNPDYLIEQRLDMLFRMQLQRQRP